MVSIPSPCTTWIPQLINPVIRSAQANRCVVFTWEPCCPYPLAHHDRGCGERQVPEPEDCALHVLVAVEDELKAEENRQSQRHEQQHWGDGETDQRKAFAAAQRPAVRAMIVGAAADVRFFRVEADHVLGLSEPINKDDLQHKIASTDRLLAVIPYPAVSTRRVALAILAGDPETARRHLRRVFAFFPGHAETAAETLRLLIRDRPEEFALLGPILDAELARRPAPRWR